MTIERTDWTFLGRIIGSATGWDGDMDSFVLYDFEPSVNVDLVACTLQIEINTGLFQGIDDAGNVLWSKDIIATLSTVS